MGCVSALPGLFVGCSLLVHLAFDVGLRGSCFCVGFSPYFAGYVFPLLFISEVEGGVIGAGSHGTRRWL